MSLTLKKRIELTERLRSLFIEHGRGLTFEKVPFFSSLPDDEQDGVKKILKKFRSGSHTPDSLIDEYQRWGDGPDGTVTRKLPYMNTPPPEKVAALAKAREGKPRLEILFRKNENPAGSDQRENPGSQRRGKENAAKGDKSRKTPKDAQREEKLQVKREKKAERRKQKNALEQALINALRENREFSDYTNVFLAARQKKRKLIAYLGPTNSGKTHAAMEALAKADSGVYLGPLRLMALENYDRLREKNVKVGLLTGEERLDLENATHICQTIETADFNRDISVAVIDEIQLLTDKDRGGFWLNAMIGIAADTVYLCGAPIIENVLHDLAELTGDELKVVYTERKSPLEFAERHEDPKKLPSPGTAFIAFSRKNVLLWKDMLEDAGAKVSVIYGALSPEVRKEQSRRFRDGETDYLVATDAVGMGLNLPIQKILFTEIEKYDGEGFRPLGPQEVKQIGGRAGRYGISSEKGIITSYVAKDLQFLRHCYDKDEKEVGLSDVHMQPTSAHIRKICESFNDHSLEFALRKFQKIGHEIFSVDISDEELIVAEKLDRIFGTDASSLSTRWFFCIAPADPKSEDTFDYFVDLAIQYKRCLERESIGVPMGIYEDEKARLEFAETQRKNLTLYLWFANKKAEVFQDRDAAHKVATFYDSLINRLLSQNSKKKKKTNGLPLSFCTRCKSMMPPFSQFEVCRDCFQAARRG